MDKKLQIGNSPIQVPIRGGSHNNGSNAGFGALNLNNVRSNVNTNIGFRPALPQSRKCLSKDSIRDGEKGTVILLLRRET